MSAGPEFESKLLKYVRPLIIKGVPSTINELHHLYKDQKKKELIETMFTKMCNQMEKDMSLSPEDEEEQDPTIQLWLYYFLSQHYLFDNKPEQALDYINKAIDHTPTVPDLYLHKAKIFYYLGNSEHA